jgi:undecaprenyl-diphosphatase
MTRASRAIVLGAVQGPTELLPVSSSAHLTSIPWLLGWERRTRTLSSEQLRCRLARRARRRSLVGQRQVIAEELRPSTPARPLFSPSPSCLRPSAASPSSAASNALGGPLPTAVGLLAGARRWSPPTAGPQRARPRRGNARSTGSPGFAAGRGTRPGVSRNGATLTARPLARIHPPARQHALAHGRPAGDRRARGASKGMPD